jgi:hypothetical protein
LRPDPNPFIAGYSNERNSAWKYNAAGNIKSKTLSQKYDVPSRQLNPYNSVGFGIQQCNERSPNGDGTSTHTGAARDRITKHGTVVDKICESIRAIYVDDFALNRSINTLEQTRCSNSYGPSIAKVWTSFERTEGPKRSGQRGLC